MSTVKARTDGVRIRDMWADGAVAAIAADTDTFLAAQRSSDGSCDILILDRQGTATGRLQVASALQPDGRFFAAPPMLIGTDLVVVPVSASSSPGGSIQMVGINVRAAAIVYDVVTTGPTNPNSTQRWCDGNTIYIQDAVGGLIHTFDGHTGQHTGTGGTPDPATLGPSWTVDEVSNIAGDYEQRVTFASFYPAAPAYAMIRQTSSYPLHTGAGALGGGGGNGEGIGCIHFAGGIGVLAASAYSNPGDGNTYASAAIVGTRTPPERLRQRSDLGIGLGAPRIRQVSTVQSSIRRRGIR